MLTSKSSDLQRRNISVQIHPLLWRHLLLRLAKQHLSSYAIENPVIKSTYFALVGTITGFHWINRIYNAQALADIHLRQAWLKRWRLFNSLQKEKAEARDTAEKHFNRGQMFLAWRAWGQMVTLLRDIYAAGIVRRFRSMFGRRDSSKTGICQDAAAEDLWLTDPAWRVFQKRYRRSHTLQPSWDIFDFRRRKWICSDTSYYTRKLVHRLESEYITGQCL